MTSSATVVPLASRRRITNFTERQTCPTCHNEGICVVGTERRDNHLDKPYDVEVTGPCPRCERGFRLEFGIGSRKVDGALVDVENPAGGPWGREGFWRGREVPLELLGGAAA